MELLTRQTLIDLMWEESDLNKYVRQQHKIDKTGFRYEYYKHANRPIIGLVLVLDADDNLNNTILQITDKHGLTGLSTSIKTKEDVEQLMKLLNI